MSVYFYMTLDNIYFRSKLQCLRKFKFSLMASVISVLKYHDEAFSQTLPALVSKIFPNVL